jgi:Transposase IS4
MLNRSSRTRAPPARLEDEQAGRLAIDQYRLIERHNAPLSSECDVEDDSDEELICDVDASSSDMSSDAEDEKENRSPNPTWSSNCRHVVAPSLTVAPGPQLPRATGTSELAVLQALLSDATIQVITTNTIAYAHSRGMPSTWQTTSEEVWLFIAVHICMGIVRLPHAHMYWDSQFRQPFVVSAFTRNRFIEMLRCFHIAPPSPPEPRPTVLDKIAPLIDACQRSFSALYNPEQVVVVDEAMVGFKGRDNWVQYIKSKPTRWGYKVWCLCSNGYLLAFNVYRGKGQGAGSMGITRRP